MLGGCERPAVALSFLRSHALGCWFLSFLPSTGRSSGTQPNSSVSEEAPFVRSYCREPPAPACALWLVLYAPVVCVVLWLVLFSRARLQTARTYMSTREGDCIQPAGRHFASRPMLPSVAEQGPRAGWKHRTPQAEANNHERRIGEEQLRLGQHEQHHLSQTRRVLRPAVVLRYQRASSRRTKLVVRLQHSK